MSTSIPTNFLTATQTIALARGNQITLSQVVEDHLDRYHSRDRKIHAWAYLDEDLVKAEAKRLDDIPPRERGPLHGMIVGVKDMICEYFRWLYNISNEQSLWLTCSRHQRYAYPTRLKDLWWSFFGEWCAMCGCTSVFGSFDSWKNRKSSPLWQCPSIFDPCCVQHTTEFAAIHVGGETTNPFDQARTPGGSSSGSAAAVSDWQCHVALGTQTVSQQTDISHINTTMSLRANTRSETGWEYNSTR